MANASAAEYTQEPELFQSAHAALVFALHYSGQAAEPSQLGKMVKSERVGTGKGLVGLDGAGQAGMILAELTQLPIQQRYSLIARCAPKTQPCSCRAYCCSGKKVNREWMEAVDILACEIRPDLAGMIDDHRLRQHLVSRFFGWPVKIGDIAKDLGLHRDTVADHNSIIAGSLRKVEHRGWHNIETRMKAAGLIPT